MKTEMKRGNDMKRSVYSIVLSDDVIKQVDRMAYREGLSRSALINRILAEYVSYVTPEQRMQDIFSKAVEMVGQMEQLQLMLRPSETHMALKSALQYKYNPTVRYSVELYRSGDALGELRVTMRTQSRALLDALNGFFDLWASVEKFSTGAMPPCSLEEGKYTRVIRQTEDASGAELGRAIVDYVTLVDSCLKLYFEGLSAGIDVSGEMVRIYREYQKTHKLLV